MGLPREGELKISCKVRANFEKITPTTHFALI
jgi:hypothetical protein